MKITLEAVTQQNYQAVCELEVKEAQKYYVASNLWSIVESKFHPEYVSRAICLDQVPVGLLMWVPETTQKMSIWRFMVGQQHQQQGIGRVALNLALAEIRQTAGLSQIEICYHPENPVAKDFYASFGFVEIGMDAEDEDMLAMIQLD